MHQQHWRGARGAFVQVVNAQTRPIGVSDFAIMRIECEFRQIGESRVWRSQDFQMRSSLRISWPNRCTRRQDGPETKADGRYISALRAVTATAAWLAADRCRRALAPAP